MIAELDGSSHPVVALLTDLPALQLRRGDVGTIVHIYGSSHRYEVEFINRTDFY
ncbi:MAG: DUF4926 domain-containing protein [Rudanella sp.]|nr:DUF4926 domain-containing protein [Rudanella sp.]